MARYIRIIFILVIFVRGSARDEHSNPQVAIQTSTPKSLTSERRVVRSPQMTPVRPLRQENISGDAKMRDNCQAISNRDLFPRSDLSPVGELPELDDEEIIQMMMMLSRLTREQTKQWIKDQQVMWKKYNSTLAGHTQEEEDAESHGLMSLHKIWT